MRRDIALVIFGVGIAVLLAGVLKVLPGGIQTGATIAFGGALLFGLSFVPRPDAPPDAPPPLSAFDRFTGIFFEPSRIFQNLRLHPRWLSALLIIALCNIIYSTAFTQRVTPERIADHLTGKLTESGWVPAEQAAKIRDQQVEDAKSPSKRVGGAISQIVWLFVLMAFLAALYLLGVLMFGGRINFWQALAVATHAMLPVVVISRLLSLLILYLKEPEDVHPILGQGGLVKDNLGALFSPAQNPVLYVAASFIGVLSFYGVWLVATGLREGGERVGKSAAWGVAITIWALAFILTVGWTALFPNFIA